MVRVRHDGDVFHATHITGPKHNYLRLKFGNSDPGKPVVTPLPAKSPKAGVKMLEADDVLKEVLAGLANRNADLETNYRIESIGFVVDDTRPINIYRTLTEKIVDMHHGMLLKLSS